MGSPWRHAQEAMYQPLGLECGHKFCADCAFTCVGKGNALGTVRAILDHVPPGAACPECRTRGVFVFAIELKETERLIRQRCAPALGHLRMHIWRALDKRMPPGFAIKTFPREEWPKCINLMVYN